MQLRINQRLQHPPCRHINKCIVGIYEIVASEFHLRPRCRARVVRDDLNAPVEVGEIRTPTAAYLEVLLVKIQVWVKGGFGWQFAMICVLPDDHYTTCFAGEAHCLD